MEPGIVEISRDGARFRVSLDPPDPSKPDAWFATAKEARGYAGGLRLVAGRGSLPVERLGVLEAPGRIGGVRLREQRVSGRHRA